MRRDTPMLRQDFTFPRTCNVRALVYLVTKKFARLSKQALQEPKTSKAMQGITPVGWPSTKMVRGAVPSDIAEATSMLSPAQGAM
jgi:hypothetical protein